jgi:hypothetical protein
MFKKVLLVVVGLVVLFLIVAAMQPTHFTITRSTTIAAPDSVIFAQVNDLHNWPNWSPWARKDPAMKSSYGGAAAGTGATYSWAGNSDVGEGRMTVVESAPPSMVRIQLEFLKPMAATDTATFSFTSSGGQTTVRWDMLGNNNLIGKAFGLVANMDKMVGDDFEKGLAGLKTVSEAAAGHAP